MNPSERLDLFRLDVAGEANRRRFPAFLARFLNGFPVGDIDETNARFRWTVVQIPAFFR